MTHAGPERRQTCSNKPNDKTFLIVVDGVDGDHLSERNSATQTFVFCSDNLRQVAPQQAYGLTVVFIRVCHFVARIRSWEVEHESVGPCEDGRCIRRAQ